jgi:hypothetical protein
MTGATDTWFECTWIPLHLLIKLIFYCCNISLLHKLSWCFTGGLFGPMVYPFLKGAFFNDWFNGHLVGWQLASSLPGCFQWSLQLQ